MIALPKQLNQKALQEIRENGSSTPNEDLSAALEKIERLYQHESRQASRYEKIAKMIIASFWTHCLGLLREVGLQPDTCLEILNEIRHKIAQ